MNKKRTFSSQKKAEITLSIIKGECTVLEASQIHSIHVSVLNRWRDEAIQKLHTIYETKQEDLETNRKLQKYEHVIAKLTTQNDFLDKVLASIG